MKLLLAMLLMSANIHAEPMQFHPLIRLKLNGHMFCSASVVSDKYAITAAHCIAKNMDIDISVSDVNDVDTGIIAKPKEYNTQLDYAVIEGDFRQFAKLELETDTDKLMHSWSKDDLVTCGYPMGGALYCNDLYNAQPFNFDWQATAHLYPGMSGGPVIDKETGKIIGVNSAVFENKSYFAPAVGIFQALAFNLEEPYVAPEPAPAPQPAP